MTAATEKLCTREAAAIKAEYLAGKRVVEPEAPPLTITAAIDEYIRRKSNTLSPATIRGYRTIQRNRFKTTMPRQLASVGSEEWQGIVNAEAALVSPKTLKEAYSLVKTVAADVAQISLPKVTMPGAVPATKAYLLPEQIKVFVQAAKDTPIAVPALLALSAMRSSEISALRWEDIPPDPKFIRVSGAVVPDETHHLVYKRQNKNTTSSRMVPILIPELTDAIRRDRQPSGPVLTLTPSLFRKRVNAICAANGLPQVGLHGLRHSFASLAYHLQMPEKIAMEIGGWADAGTMHRIYTHIARADIERYQNAIGSFYSGENANKNANSSP